MKKPILIIVYVAVAVAVIGYAYVVFSNRYGNKPESNSNENKGSIIDNFSNYLGEGNENSNLAGGNQNENLDVSKDQNQNENVNANANTNTNSDSASLKDVTSKDCSDDCSRFEDNAANYKYCQQICGDIPISKKNSAENCANLTGDEKDYCLKDLAVTKKDFSICNQIQDAKIKKVCKNRITEDLIN